jgi:hypothetical protein
MMLIILDGTPSAAGSHDYSNSTFIDCASFRGGCMSSRKKISQQCVFLETCFIETTVVSTNRSYFHNMLRVTYNTLHTFLKE